MVTHKATRIKWLHSWWSFFLRNKACPYLKFKWSLQPGTAVLMDHPSQLLAQQGTWSEGKTETHHKWPRCSSPSIPQPSNSIHQDVSKANPGGYMDCPGNGGSKAEGNIPLQMGRRIQGRSFPCTNDIPGRVTSWRWRLTLQSKLANIFHLGYS